jgi:hypothetical protein
LAREQQEQQGHQEEQEDQEQEQEQEDLSLSKEENLEQQHDIQGIYLLEHTKEKHSQRAHSDHWGK